MTAGRADRCRLCRRFHRTADCPTKRTPDTPPPGVPAPRAANRTRVTWPPASTPPPPALTEVTQAEEIVGPRGGPILLLTLACGHRLWRSTHRAPPKRTTCVACWLEAHAHGEKGIQ